MPESQVFPIDAAEPAVAALAEPVSIAVRSIHRSGISEGERVVILGAGRSARPCTCWRVSGERRRCSSTACRAASSWAQRTAPKTLDWTDRDQVVEDCREWSGGEGPPLVFDATGAPDPIRAAVDMVASAGRVVVVGMSGEEVPLRIGTFTEKEIDMLGVSCCGSDEFREAVGFVEAHRESLERLISRRFPLDEAPEAVGYAMDNPEEVMKVVITSS